MVEISQQQKTDAEHLKLISVFHYVVAGMAALFACIPLIHLALGLLLVLTPGKFGPPSNSPPAFLGFFFIVIAGFFILAGWTFAILVALNGRFLSQRRRYTFCFVMACVECMFMPFGTVLGVFTIMVLMRSTVKELFTPKPGW